MVSFVEPLGLAGILLFFAGLHLLWQAREEIFFWFLKYILIFQDALRARGEGLAPREASGGRTVQEQGRPATAGVFRLMSGFGLLFLGPLLVLLSLFLSM